MREGEIKEIRIKPIKFEKWDLEYYLDYEFFADLVESEFFGPFDENGIPMVDLDNMFRKYHYFTNSKYGINYFPVVITQYAISHLQKFLRYGKEESKSIFLRQCEWLLNNLYIRKRVGVYRHFFDFPTYGLKAPWLSSLSQGQAISVLARAYKLIKNSKFLEAIQYIFKSFESLTSEGGCKVIDSRGYIWFEEYPSKPPSFVLNGNLFAVLGIYDYYKLMLSKKSNDLFIEAVRSVNESLYFYDAWGWSKYDRVKYIIVDKMYHHLHISQLKVLKEICRIEGISFRRNNIKFFAEKWERCYENGLCKVRIFPLKVLSKVKQIRRGVKFYVQKK
jgi:hypothetical protein